jgi:hypothetical protein
VLFAVVVVATAAAGPAEPSTGAGVKGSTVPPRVLLLVVVAVAAGGEAEVLLL